MKEIKQKLIELGFKVNTKGFLYWIEAIEYAKKRRDKYKMGDVYDYIAKKHNDTYMRVEKAMRFSRTPANNNIQQEFHYYLKVDNRTFLNLIIL